MNPKRALYAQFAAVAKALGHEHRLELLELIAQGERTVESLADRCGITLPRVRHSAFAHDRGRSNGAVVRSVIGNALRLRAIRL